MNNIHKSSRISQGELPAKNLRPALKLRTYNEEGRPSLISGMETVKLLGRYFVKMPLQDYYFRILDDGNVDYLNPLSEAMMLVVLQDLGIKNIVVAKNYLKCETIREISPLHLVYDQIIATKWDGRDRINEAIDAMNLKGDSTVNFHLIKKFYINTYSLAFQRIDLNIKWLAEPRGVFILYSDGKGWGKSAILNFLGLGNVLRKTIPSIETEVITVLRGEIPTDDWTLNNLLTTNMMINIDDLQNCLNNPDANTRAKLRALCTTMTSSQRQMRTEKVRNKARRANICGSTNNRYALRDGDENRYMMFELKSKCKDLREYGNDFLIQFWAQLRMESLKADEQEINWNSSDSDLIIANNKPFLYKSEIEMEVEDAYRFREFANEYTFNELREEVSKLVYGDFSYTKIPDKSLRAALLRLVPSGKELHGKRISNKRFINIVRKDDSFDTCIEAGDGLPF